MKKLHILILLVANLVMAQQPDHIGKQIAENERSNAIKTVNFRVNPNTQNYDVTYHQLEFTVDPALYFINGKVTTTFTALSDMTTITFDFANELTTSMVTKNGVNLSFTENTNNELIITLPTTLIAGNTATIEITYSGAPPVNGFESFSSKLHNGVPIIYTLSEPYGARDWWPCKQDLNDKINSLDVYITAPSQYTSVSNGIEPAAPVIVGTNKTTHFHHSYPIPAYLVCMAVTNYSVYNQTVGSGTDQFPIVNYLYPENFSAVIPQLAQTPLLLNLYKNLFEIYPFHNEKYGHAQFSWGGGMEHTTVSFMVNFNRQLIAHEMAHQWFGNKITCGSWKDIWLNEGFATYLASLAIENFDGNAAFVADKESMINTITATTNGAVVLNDVEITNVNRIFSWQLSYSKGAMVLEMLRWKLGDVLFFQGMKNYLADTNLAYKYAVTNDFKSHMEAVYGSNLTDFFNDWVFNQGYPKYTITAQNTAAGQVTFLVNQTQSHPSVTYFEMPIPIRVLGNSGQRLDLVLNNTSNGQVFTENIPFQIISFEIDPDKHLISKFNTAQTLNASNLDLDKAIMVTPNPMSSELKISIPLDVVIETSSFYDIFGKKVLESKSQNINVSPLATGVYIVAITTNKGTIHKKIIKN